MAPNAHHNTSILWRNLTLGLSLLVLFVFSVPVFLTPGATANDFFDSGRTSPPLSPAGEPPHVSSSGRANVSRVLSEGIRRPPDMTRGPEDRKELSITFDGGGYDDVGAAQILKVLRDRGIKTTVFLTGRFISKYPGLTREIVADGHEVGNHTFDHPHLTELVGKFRQKTLRRVDRKFLTSELKKADALFKKATGGRMAPLWRAPYGEENAGIRRWALEDGYVHVGWTFGKGESLDTLDWVDDKSSRLYRSPEEIKERILRFGRNAEGVSGGIILMHLSTNRDPEKMAAMIGDLIDSLRKRGYRFVKVSRLMRDNRVLKAMEVRRAGERTGRRARAIPAGRKRVVQREQPGHIRN